MHGRRFALPESEITYVTGRIGDQSQGVPAGRLASPVSDRIYRRDLRAFDARHTAAFDVISGKHSLRAKLIA